MKTDLLEICENQTLNIGLKFISIRQNIRKSSILATFWTVNELDWFKDDMAERERLRKERDLGKRDSERERGIKTER